MRKAVLAIAISITLTVLAIAISITLLGSFAFISADRTRHLPESPAFLYKVYNAAYFDGLLPDIEVVDAEPPDQTKGADTYGETFHTTGSHWYKMFISPNENRLPSVEEETILHESCHVYVWEQGENAGEEMEKGHGPQFQDCMLSLAKKHAFDNIW